jgi:mannose-6-phosphate isomerase
VARLTQLFPREPLVAAPLLLNLVTLEPLEGLVVAPGTVHSYLVGLGVEVMTCSDNVVRAGLTSKHLDPGELRRIMHETATAPEVVTPAQCSAQRSEYATGSDAFQIALETVESARLLSRSSRPGPEIVLCVEGNVELCRQVGGPSLELRRGEAALIPACVEDCPVLGEARILRVTGLDGPNETGQRERGE